MENKFWNKMSNLFNNSKKIVISNPTDLLINLGYSRPELPLIVEKKNNEWVSYGANNLYPNDLLEYLNTSAIHAAIVQSKAKMQAGDGLKLNIKDNRALTVDEEIVLKRLINHPNKENTLEEVISQVALDYQIFGAYALEVIWNSTFTKISEIKYIPVKNIRSGKMKDGDVQEYYYSRDWSKVKQYKPIAIPTFNSNSRKEYEKDSSYNKFNQLVYVKYNRSGLEYYGEPMYQSALAWIKIDSQIGLFHLSNIENGFNPSMTVKFFKKPGSPEEQQMIVNALNSQFQGARNTGKGMIFFSDGKELAPEVTPISVQNLDKQFITVAEQVVQQIISGHSVTSPMLVGVATPGKLGYSSELEKSYLIFDKTVIAPDRKAIEKTLNKLIEASGVKNVELEIIPFNPLIDPASTLNKETGEVVLAQTLGVGGTQSLMSILTDPVLTSEQKVGIMGTLFGISEVDAKRMLAI